MALPRSDSVELSVVIPAHNSARVIESTITAFADRLSTRHAEIIVVENGSSDETAAICARLVEDWSHPSVSLTALTSDKGMGNALRVGVSDSRGRQVLLTADDLPFGFGDLDAAEAYVDRTGSTPLVAIGSKAHPGSDVQRGALRSLMTFGFTSLRRIVLGTRTKDPQGTFLVEGALLRSLAPHLSEPGFLFTTELDYAVELAGISPVELPVQLSASHRAQPSRVALSDVVNMARGLLTLRHRKLELRRAATAGLSSSARS
ncbi:MAG: glycosyltransferase [Rhodococcus sp. (in: high G+C Gram-positive bacteria)]|uniref:glycosyltransferase n=1 Tax=Rhodococcus sp. TaxID=1831 RepID=UPI002ADCFFD2|nr:glycosyltransferase [Rhodococcus sp. (in: high G+C Gram-positive bacteria)]